MANIILIFLCLGLGVLLKHKRILPIETPVVLNQFVVYISLPAMTLHYIPNIILDSKVIYPIGVAWIGFGLSFLIFATLGKFLNWSRTLIGCMILMSGLGNTSYVGIPVVEALYGKEGLETLMMVDQPGSFVVLSTVGIAVATAYSSGTPSLNLIAKKIFYFPPFLVFVLTIIMNLMGIKFPDTLDEVFEKLALTVTPLALVSVGYQLKIEMKGNLWKYTSMGLIYQLIIWPAVIYILYILIVGQSGTSIQVCVIEAAMAPMITAAIITSAYGLEPKLSNMMVGVGIPLSFLTIALWYWIIHLV